MLHGSGWHLARYKDAREHFFALAVRQG
jgi:hypothetical protein